MLFKFTELMVNVPAKASGDEVNGPTGCGCSFTVPMDPESMCTWVSDDAGYAGQANGGMLAALRQQLQQAVALA